MSRVAELLSGAAQSLGECSASPRADAAILLAHLLRRDRSWLIAHDDAEPSAEEVERFHALCDRRRTGVPVAYLLGSAHFYGREFLVNESVLVPRPETEHLADEALRFIRGPMRMLDVGTGCGAIACTIAARSAALVDATDVSAPAIALATENARRLGVADRCRFYLGDLADPVRSERYDLIVANLPYIPTNDLPQPPDPAGFEPRGALDGGPDGLRLYRRLLPQLAPLLNETALLLLEAARPNIDPLGELVQSALPGAEVEKGCDYAGLRRYVKALRRAPRELRAGSAASEAARSQGGRERG